jgi:hypothetical protein
VSARYFKQVMLISEVNGRISELREKLRSEGLAVESSKEKDRYGFVYHRLKRLVPVADMSVPELLAASREAVTAFDRA